MYLSHIFCSLNSIVSIFEIDQSNYSLTSSSLLFVSDVSLGESFFFSPSSCSCLFIFAGSNRKKQKHFKTNSAVIIVTIAEQLAWVNLCISSYFFFFFNLIIAKFKTGKRKFNIRWQKPSESCQLWCKFDDRWVGIGGKVGEEVVRGNKLSFTTYAGKLGNLTPFCFACQGLA